MKKTDDQIDFNFSRPIDVQINLEVEFINFVLKDHASTPLEGQVLTVGPGGEASFQSSGSGVSEPKAIAFAIALG